MPVYKSRNRSRSAALGRGQFSYRPKIRYRRRAITLYAQSRIRTGKHLLKFSPETDIIFRLLDSEYRSAREIAENWRASHAYPMQIMRNNLSNRARKIDSKSIVAQRLKQFSSIVSKLGRERDMKLSR